MQRTNDANGRKKKLVVVGKIKQIRCFERVKALPVDYTANKNSWMTQVIFRGSLTNELEKILLLVHNCIAHNVSFYL